MVAPFELVLKDSALQENWFRRLIAVIIDSILLGIVYAILAVLFFIGMWSTSGSFSFGALRLGIFGVGALITWLLSVLYYAITESMWGASIGKMLLGLKVVGEDGNKPLLVNAFIRNVSRIHGLLFLLDFIGGMVLEGDPRQRFTDRVAKTVVYQAKSNRGGPFVESRILTSDETAAADSTPPPATGAPPQPESPPQPGTAPEGEQKPAEDSPGQGAKCPKCGVPVKEGNAFCPQCGTKLGSQ